MIAALGLAAMLSWVAPAGFERVQGFSTIVYNHVERSLGVDNLPAGTGVPVDAALLVTIGMDELELFDRKAVALSGGSVTDPTIAVECLSRCPAVLYDAMAEAWLEHAVEASMFPVEIPTRVLFAVDRNVPARMLVQAAYAAAETRPVSPPGLAILVNSDRAGVRAQPFHLLPPAGLELRRGSAALGLTIDVAPGAYAVSTADAGYRQRTELSDPKRLLQHLRDLKKRYPGKEAVILVPDDRVAVAELLQIATMLQPVFPRIVLSTGQTLQIQ